MPPAKARKAKEIASQVIDKVADKSLLPKEQQRRKRALIRGPKEFREIRGSQTGKVIDHRFRICGGHVAHGCHTYSAHHDRTALARNSAFVVATTALLLAGCGGGRSVAQYNLNSGQPLINKTIDLPLVRYSARTDRITSFAG